MDYALHRKNMVEGQVLPNRVTDPLVIEALYEIPRESFVPKQKMGIAYMDEVIDLGGGRYLIEPMVLARLLAGAEIKPSDIVLDIACGTGYSSAVAAKIADTVVALESDKELAEAATKILNKLGLDNAVVIEGDVSAGYAKQGPYDVILINGSVDKVPTGIIEQLAEGGRLITVINGKGGVGRAILMIRKNGIVSTRELFDAGSPCLKEFSDNNIAFAF